MHSAMADKDTPKPTMKRPTICKEFIYNYALIDKLFYLKQHLVKLAIKFFEENRFQSTENPNENLI